MEMIQVKTFFNSNQRIWHGFANIAPIYHPDLSVGQAILEYIQQNPNKIAQVSANNDFKMRNCELASMMMRVSRNLEIYGIQQEDIIGIIASNSQYLAPIAFGAFLNGTPINTLDPSFKQDNIQHMFGITKPKLIFCDVNCYDEVIKSVEELQLKCKIFIMNGDVEGVASVVEFFKEIDDEKNFIAPKLKNGGNQTAIILCSSGTTGLPKGVCVSHNTVLSSIMVPFTHDDTLLCFSTIYWLTGLFILTYGTLRGTKRVIIDEPFSVEHCFNIIEKYNVTIILTPPSHLAMLVQSPEINTRNLSSMRAYLTGGSAVHPEIKIKMEEYLKNGKVYIGYAMTELGGLCTVETAKDHKYGSVGQLAKNIEVKLINSDGNSMGIGEIGEILVRHNSKWNGYYGNPDATKLTIDDNNWIHSGDLGYFDDEGFLFIVDRIKDILKYNNFHFYPTEIETIIFEIPNVAAVSVCGIPDLCATDLPAAAIIKKPNTELTEQEVHNHVANRLADYKQLRGGVYFLDSLPQTASGKFQRNKIKEILIKLRETK